MGRRYYSDETLPQDSDTRAVSEKARRTVKNREEALCMPISAEMASRI